LLLAFAQITYPGCDVQLFSQRQAPQGITESAAKRSDAWAAIFFCRRRKKEMPEQPSIRELRGLLGLSQGKLAREIKINRTDISLIETDSILLTPAVQSKVRRIRRFLERRVVRRFPELVSRLNSDSNKGMSATG
jgi:DNA-binding XRE family transcriptional regulator